MIFKKRRVSTPNKNHVFQLPLTQEEKKKSKIREKRLSITFASTKKKLAFTAE